MAQLTIQSTPGTNQILLSYPQTKDAVTTAQSDTVQLLTYTIDSTMPTDGVAYTMTSTGTPLYAGTYNTDSEWVKDTEAGRKELPYPTWKVQEKEATTQVPHNKELPYPQGKTS
jgi:hypothetical protein